MRRLLWVAALAGCSQGKQNVAACEAYVESLACGDYDFSVLYPEGYCETWAETECDVSEYFRCLDRGSDCAGGEYYPALDCIVPGCG
jgi:hypothetical protein